MYAPRLPEGRGLAAGAPLPRGKGPHAGIMVDSDHADISNAYTILSNIQGFDSFHLGPTSSPDEITRAFQTQSLIWHPEKNPGDPQALAVFRRMQQAYTLLMDTPSRAELDSRPQSTGTAAPGSAEQLSAEDLGAPPPTARPFSFVDKAPQPQTPAGRAGLARGDAVLRLGTDSVVKRALAAVPLAARATLALAHGGLLGLGRAGAAWALQCSPEASPRRCSKARASLLAMQATRRS